MKSHLDYQIFSEDFNTKKVFDYVVSTKDGKDLFEEMSQCTNFTNATTLNTVYILAIYNFMKTYSYAPKLCKVLALVVPRVSDKLVDNQKITLLTRDNLDDVKDYKIISLNPIFDRIFLMITGGKTYNYKYITMQNSDESLKLIDSDYSMKITGYPYNKANLTYDEEQVAESIFTVQEIRLIGQVMKCIDFTDNLKLSRLELTLFKFLNKLSKPNKIYGFGLEKCEYNYRLSLTEKLEDVIDKLQSDLYELIYTEVTEDIVAEYELEVNADYLLYINTKAEELNMNLSSKLLEVLTIQYCFDFKDDFYLDSAFHNNEIVEVDFGPDVINNVDYINLAINNERLLSLDEVLERVL